MKWFILIFLVVAVSLPLVTAELVMNDAVCDGDSGVVRFTLENQGDEDVVLSDAEVSLKYGTERIGLSSGRGLDPGFSFDVLGSWDMRYIRPGLSSRFVADDSVLYTGRYDVRVAVCDEYASAAVACLSGLDDACDNVAFQVDACVNDGATARIIFSGVQSLVLHDFDWQKDISYHITTSKTAYDSHSFLPDSLAHDVLPSDRFVKVDSKRLFSRYVTVPVDRHEVSFVVREGEEVHDVRLEYEVCDKVVYKECTRVEDTSGITGAVVLDNSLVSRAPPSGRDWFKFLGWVVVVAGMVLMGYVVVRRIP